MDARVLLLSWAGGNHVLMLVNGHAINDEWGGWAPVDRELGVPIELIDHIEISLGPGSVLYGTSAMFGVVNVVTRDPYQQVGKGSSPDHSTHLRRQPASAAAGSRPLACT